MLNILVVEDDNIQKKNLIKMIYEVDKSLIIHEAKSKEEALKVSKENNIDFFYIDISLKNSSGLDFALEIRDIEKYKFSWIVFITTHVNYMIQAFKEIHCYDYIIKPYDKEEVIKITKNLVSGSYIHNKLENQHECIVFDLKNGISVKLNIDDIVFIETSLRGVTIHTLNSKYSVKKISLTKILAKTNSDQIIQSHKSFIVNVNHIKKINPLSNKLWEIIFNKFDKKALLGYKYKNSIINMFKGIIKY